MTDFLRKCKSLSNQVTIKLDESLKFHINKPFSLSIPIEFEITFDSDDKFEKEYSSPFMEILSLCEDEVEIFYSNLFTPKNFDEGKVTESSNITAGLWIVLKGEDYKAYYNIHELMEFE